MKKFLSTGRSMMLVCFITLLSAASAPACAQPTQDALLIAQLPVWTHPVIEADAFRTTFLLDTSINPFMQHADFNADGFLDVAVLIRNATTGERGVMLLFNGALTPFILGAGQTTINDVTFDRLLIWHVEARLPAGAALAPDGDILILSGLDGAYLWLFAQDDVWQWVTP